VTRCLATCFNVTFSIENHVYKDLEWFGVFDDTHWLFFGFPGPKIVVDKFKSFQSSNSWRSLPSSTGRR
jgi:hypothetical protein